VICVTSEAVDTIAYFGYFADTSTKQADWGSTVELIAECPAEISVMSEIVKMNLAQAQQRLQFWQFQAVAKAVDGLVKAFGDPDYTAGFEIHPDGSCKVTGNFGSSNLELVVRRKS
jgi:hypothetical protein